MAVETHTSIQDGCVDYAIHQCGPDPAFVAWECRQCGKRGIDSRANYIDALSRGQAIARVHNNGMHGAK